ncbi:MAG: phage resistance protein, partial [Pseudomonas sp.]|nr:phage resistance protein [Pseudomonas sp.]
WTRAHRHVHTRGPVRATVAGAFCHALVPEADAGGGDAGWGALGDGWDASSYESAANAAPEDSEHQRLVGDLVDAFFSHLRNDAGANNYVSLDRGLAILSRHAKDLGYSAVVLFLDELILWLASHSQDSAFLNREGQKVSKLVEAGDADRPIPIASFIARQRDLRELVGAAVPGAQQLAFADVLQWWEARFDKIVLEDRNLPAIIERRLLQVKGPEQKRELHEAFERTAKVRQEVLDILLTHEGDKRMFAQVYPFSPALVQALVALSSLLQRERTALKLMLQLLVQNKDRLLVGDVIPVGDLFDVIIEGDEPFTPAIKNMFDRAREVWTRKFVPLLEAEHDVADQEVRDGTADPATTRRYRADAGL